MRYPITAAIVTLAILSSAAAHAQSGRCSPPVDLPPIRRDGQLEVRSPPLRQASYLRLRTHVGRAKTRLDFRNGKARMIVGPRPWIGPEVPRYVKLRLNDQYLDLLDPIDGGYLALYRQRPGTCTKAGKRSQWANCAATARIYTCAGRVKATVPLNRFMSRSTHLEVQDIRYDDGVVYFNEACLSYSRLAGGRCSSLVAVDPFRKKRLFRTPPRVSNYTFAVHDDVIAVVYGFTGEPSMLRLVRKKDGRILSRVSLARHPLRARAPISDLHFISEHYLRVSPQGQGQHFFFYLEGAGTQRRRAIYISQRTRPRHRRRARN